MSRYLVAGCLFLLFTNTLSATPKKQLESKCKGGNGKACNELAILLEDAGDSSASLKSFRRSCQLGYKASCEYLKVVATEKNTETTTTSSECGDLEPDYICVDGRIWHKSEIKSPEQQQAEANAFEQRQEQERVIQMQQQQIRQMQLQNAGRALQDFGQQLNQIRGGGQRNCTSTPNIFGGYDMTCN